MKLAWVVIVVAAVETACACQGSSGGKGTGPGTGTGSGPIDVSACADQEDHVRGLYQAAAPRVDMTEVEVADNVAMVMAACGATPATVAPCLAKVSAVAQLERTCLPPLDDEGRDGLVFLGR